MVWTSQTGHFGAEEIAAIEHMDTGSLVAFILKSDPLVALRALVELWLHDDMRLAELLQRPDINAHWHKFGDDWGANAVDNMYSKQLEKRIVTQAT